ncbi:MAG: hypothetical protein IT384_26245 [Deltaproteobacteria bacterium]|nr:hypothetical protein [Deltaproteobacteria bacterium]
MGDRSRRVFTFFAVTLLSLAGGLGLEGRAGAVAAPPQCPWQLQSYQLLNPSGAALPINGSVWVRDYGNRAARPSLWDVTAAEPVAADTLTTTVTQTAGLLIQLRPRSLLTADHSYEVRMGEGASVFAIGVIHTATLADTRAPRAPMITQSGPINDPYTVCQTAGVLISYSLADPAEPLLLLAEAQDGSLLELNTNPSLGQVFGAIAIPTMANERVDAKIVAVDLAGNRSDAVFVSATAGTVAYVQGKFPNDPNGEGGCSCEAAPGSGEQKRMTSAFAGLLFLVWVVARRSGSTARAP